MNIDNQLSDLKKITTVDPPASLLGKIKERVDKQPYEVLTLKWKLSFAVAAMIVFTLNIAVIISVKHKNNEKDVQQVIGALQLSPSNNLYDE